VKAGVLLPVVRLSLRDMLQVAGGFDPLRAVHLNMIKLFVAEEKSAILRAPKCVLKF
jgi:hypothetical protein